MPRQFFDVGVRDGKAALQVERCGIGAHALTGNIGISHAQLLRAQLAPQNCRQPKPQCRLVDIELVRVDSALHDGFAKTVTCRDEHGVAESRLGIKCEQHACGPDIRTHHQLHTRRQEDVLVLETVMHAIGDRAVVVQGSKHLLDPVQHVLDADHIQEGFLLSGE